MNTLIHKIEMLLYQKNNQKNYSRRVIRNVNSQILMKINPTSQLTSMNINFKLESI